MYRSKLRVAMQSNKSRENRRGNNRRRGRKEDKYAVARMKDPKSDEFCPYAANSEDKIGNVEQESSLDRENSDNGKLESALFSLSLSPSFTFRKSTCRCAGILAIRCKLMRRNRAIFPAEPREPRV